MSTAGAYDYDVCVVGMGPTGMTLAHLLGMYGVRVLLLEREPEFYGMARAVFTDDECLRIMQRAGLADELHADMLADLPVQWVAADGSVLGQFADSARDHGWPSANFLYQPAYESTLEKRLAERETVTVRRGRAVVSFAQDADGVTVEHVGCTGAGYGRDEPSLEAGSEESVRVRWLVGADGGRSVVRTQLGIEMAGRSFPQRWLVIDLHARAGRTPFAHLPYFDFVCDPDLPTVSCPQPGGRHRFEFMLHDDDSTEDFSTREVAEDLMARYVDVEDVVVDRQLVYTFNALLAERWREGRVLLAGDAAHMSPQFIGQGMNGGLRDADNLAWKLADVVLRGADPALLDSYEAERRPHIAAMINLSVFNKDVVSLASPALQRLRTAGMWASAHVPGLKGYVRRAKMLPEPRLRSGSYVGLARRAGGLRGEEGALMPQFAVRRLDGTWVRLDDEVGAGWVVLGIGVDPRPGADADLWESLGATYACLHPAGSRPSGRRAERSNPADSVADLVAVEAIDEAATRWLSRAGAGLGSVVVLRPDKFVLAVTGAGDLATAESYVRAHVLGGQPAVDLAVARRPSLLARVNARAVR